MSKLRISDAPLLPNVNGSEKIPTGGRGDLAISMEQVKTFAQGGLPQQIEDHINDTENPHQVSKSQVGLGNVDNTADADKPVSNSTQAAIISAVTPKADKIYVDSQLALKADNNEVKRGIANRYDSTLTYNSGERVVLTNGDIVKSVISGNANNPNIDMTGWVKAKDSTQLEYSLLKNKITRTLYDKLYETWSAKDLGAIGDGTIHTVQEWIDSGKFSGLAGIQVVFPHVTSLSDSIDWAATQKAVNDLPLAVENTDIFSPRSSPNGGRIYFPHGRFVFNKKLSLKRGVQLVGESRESSQLLFLTNNGGIEYLDSGRDVPDEITIRDLAVFQDQDMTPVSGAGITCIDGPSPVVAVALNVENVLIDGFYHNILLSAAITSSVRNVNSTNSVNHGIYVKFSSGYTLSTSIKFDTVYSSLSKNGSGFRIEGAAYSFFSACASDSNARYGYELSGTNTCGLDGGAEFNYLGGVHSTQCRSPRIFVNIVANSTNLTCDAVTLNETAGAVIGGVHSSGADQGGMSIRSVASGVHGIVEQGLIRTGGWNNPNQRSNASHSIAFGGILNGFTGGTRRQWAFGASSALNNIQLHNSGNADSTVEHGFVSDVVLAKNNPSINAAIIARAQTQNTAVTYGVLSGLYSQSPVKGTGSTVNRYYGALIDESTIGAISNVNLMIGGLFAPEGNWNIYSPSTRPSYMGGSLSWKPAISATPTNNGELTFELTSDTQLKVKVKGSDGVVRSATIILT